SIHQASRKDLNKTKHGYRTNHFYIPAHYSGVHFSQTLRTDMAEYSTGTKRKSERPAKEKTAKYAARRVWPTENVQAMDSCGIPFVYLCGFPAYSDRTDRDRMGRIEWPAPRLCYLTGWFLHLCDRIY